MATNAVHKRGMSSKTVKEASSVSSISSFQKISIENSCFKHLPFFVEAELFRFTLQQDIRQGKWQNADLSHGFPVGCVGRQFLWHILKHYIPPRRNMRSKTRRCLGEVRRRSLEKRCCCVHHQKEEACSSKSIHCRWESLRLT